MHAQAENAHPEIPLNMKKWFYLFSLLILQDFRQIWKLEESSDLMFHLDAFR